MGRSADDRDEQESAAGHVVSGSAGAQVRGTSRRSFLLGAGKTSLAAAVVGGSVGGGYLWSSKTASASTTTDAAVTTTPVLGAKHFVSRPDLTPPAVTVTDATDSASSTPYFFLAPKGYTTAGPGSPGPLVIDRLGRPIWFKSFASGTTRVMDFRAQTYKGKPVLTWWEGTVLSGYGSGAAVILDDTYTEIARVDTGNGWKADLHEFRITPSDTALFTAYKQVTADLSSIGGSSKGTLLTCSAQEVDIATGKVLFEWDSLDHVGVEESYIAAPTDASTLMDYFHINSVARTPDGDLLISARNTSTLYCVSRTTGAVKWRLGGKKSDFPMTDETRFWYQHDAQMPASDLITMFDDGSSPAEEEQSRGLALTVDVKARTVSVKQEYVHPSRLLADNQGSYQSLDNGHVLIGWGAEPYFSEFDADGTLVLDGQMPENVQSYRTYSASWVGKPTEVPAVSVGKNSARGASVYVSWNGATAVARWRVLAGTKVSALASVGEGLRTGFETMVTVNHTGPYFVAVALDADGNELGRSATVHASL